MTAFAEKYGPKAIIVSLAIVFIWFGLIKYTTGGAEGVSGLVQNSPFMAWLYSVFSVKTFAALLGTVEIIIGLLLLAGLSTPKLGILGGLGGIATFLVTLHFMLTTPGVVREGASFPILSSMPGEFLLKDIVLLAASLWIVGNRAQAARGGDTAS